MILHVYKPRFELVRYDTYPKKDNWSAYKLNFSITLVWLCNNHINQHVVGKVRVSAAHTQIKVKPD